MADASDSARENALRDYFARALKNGTIARATVETHQAAAAAALIDGTTVVEVTVEGGATRAQVNCPPHIVANACEAVLKEGDPDNALASTDPRHKYADFSGGRIET